MYFLGKIPKGKRRAVNPPCLQILRIDGERMINDVICEKKKKRTKKMLLEL